MLFQLNRVLGTLFLLWFAAWSHAGDKTYSFGVAPQPSSKQLARLWTPIFQSIKRHSGVKLQSATAKNIPEFEKRLATGVYDFAYMNLHHFTLFNQDPDYRSLLVRIDQLIREIVVVRKDSPLTNLTELAGELLAFPSPAAFAASVLPRAQLSQQKTPYTPRYISSHYLVYLNMAKGLFSVGGRVNRTFNNIKPEVKALLKSLKIKKGLQSVQDSDWDDVRGLGLGILDSLIN